MTLNSFQVDLVANMWLDDLREWRETYEGRYAVIGDLWYFRRWHALEAELAVREGIANYFPKVS